MCAIVGVINSKDAAKTAYYGLFSMQHRGQEASGISSSYNQQIKTIKNRGLVTEVFNSDSFEILQGQMAIGHNRYSTAGSDSVLDAQPVSAKYSLGEISIVHNGNLINKYEVRERLIEDGAIFQSNMDTENILHLIAKSKRENLQDRIIEALGQIVGAYCLLILSRSKMFVVRDPYGVRPLSIGRLKDGGYIVASESCAFDLVGATFVRDVAPGEMIVFEEGKSSFKSIDLFEARDPRICAFEYIYFARPDSVIDGKNVYEIRKKLGEIVFSNKKSKETLERILHPKIKEEILKQAKALESKKIPYFLDIPLFYETNNYPFKEVLLVFVPKEIQVQRIQKRDHLESQAIQTRISSQISLEEKKKLANYIIDNSGDLENLQKEVEKYLQDYIPKVLEEN